jgi:hypothetical protein
MKIIISCAALLLAVGCMSERPYESIEVDGEGFAMTSDFSNFAEDGVRPVDGQLNGDVGPAMRSLDEPATVNGYHDSQFTSLEVIVSNSRGSAMTMLDFHGGIDSAQLAPGTRQSFDGYDNGEPGEVYVTGIACSGESDPYDWSYDEPLERVDVEVEETGNPEVLRYNFTTVDMAGDEAYGHADVVVPG